MANLNADFSKKAIMHSEEMPWVASPLPGVHRRMLDRLGDEVARATTIVRYDPNSSFSPHIHTGGEEFFVLDGVFQDEHGDFPAGTYVRNPPQSSHTPKSDHGCTIFVKLWQFDLSDRTHTVIDTGKMRYLPDAQHSGVEVMPLFSDGREDVVLERWQTSASLKLDAPGGMEILVLEGSIANDETEMKRHAWMRLPKHGSASVKAGPQGAVLWIKRGHLAQKLTAPD